MRVLVISSTGDSLAELLRPCATALDVRPLLHVLNGGPAEADLVVLHTHAPIRELTALATLPPPRPPVLVVAYTVAPGDVVPILRAGARSLLVEGQYTRADLLDAALATADGHSRMSPVPLSVVVDHVQHRSSDRTPALLHQPLTRREHEIMDLIAAGEPNAAIAVRLDLAEKTVRNRVSQIYLKLRVNNRTEAIVQWLSRTERRSG
ncbi:LuxR C-terminal-related transcriptional regulator [Dactylosporangium sp. NPDC050688]|uniref:LuxR C-terminal-related transcriptional regulator n=1 Tax=Dactylosporangium sp. NPDC050688 TaxID=3157217 RepID=UPI00340CCE0F